MKPVTLNDACTLEGTGLLFHANDVLPLSSQPPQQNVPRGVPLSHSAIVGEGKEGKVNALEASGAFEGTRVRTNRGIDTHMAAAAALPPLDHELVLRQLARDLGTGPLPAGLPALREVVLGKRAKNNNDDNTCDDDDDDPDERFGKRLESAEMEARSNALASPAFLVSGPYASLSESLRSLEKCVQQIQDKLGFSLDEDTERLKRRVQETTSFLRLEEMMSTAHPGQSSSLVNRVARLMHELQYWGVIRQHLARELQKQRKQAAEVVREADVDALCERMAAYVAKRNYAEELWVRVNHSLKRLGTLYPLMETEIRTFHAREIIQEEQSDETRAEIKETLRRVQEMREALVKDDATVRSSAAFFQQRWEVLEKR